MWRKSFDDICTDSVRRNIVSCQLHRSYTFRTLCKYAMQRPFTMQVDGLNRTIVGKKSISDAMHMKWQFEK